MKKARLPINQQSTYVYTNIFVVGCMDVFRTAMVNTYICQLYILQVLPIMDMLSIP